MTRTCDPQFADRVRASFCAAARDDADPRHAAAGRGRRTEIHVPHWEGIEQQHGFVHGGVVGMIADSAAGYAAMTVVPAEASVLTVEYKMNLVAPADGETDRPRQGRASGQDTDRHPGRGFCREGWQGKLVRPDAADHHDRHPQREAKTAPREPEK